MSVVYIPIFRATSFLKLLRSAGECLEIKEYEIYQIFYVQKSTKLINHKENQETGGINTLKIQKQENRKQYDFIIDKRRSKNVFYGRAFVHCLGVYVQLQLSESLRIYIVYLRLIIYFSKNIIAINFEDELKVDIFKIFSYNLD